MTIDQVQRQLRRIGLRPQTAAGQNFLLDESVVASMIAAADVSPDDTVLEIGPGLGILTRELAATGAKVIAVELDQRLAGWLTKELGGHKNLMVVTNDIFKVHLAKYVEDQSYKIVANLPYSSTSLIFRNFLTLSPRPRSMTVMVQRDVADRITAAPGDLSVLGVMVQHYSQVDRLFDIPPSSFFPSPRVTSSVIYLHDLKPVDPTDEHLFRIVRAGFSARRKLLVNSLAGTLRRPTLEIAVLLKKIGLPPTVRAQEIPVETWPKIAKILG